MAPIALQPFRYENYRLSPAAFSFGMYYALLICVWICSRVYSGT